MTPHPESHFERTEPGPLAKLTNLTLLSHASLAELHDAGRAASSAAMTVAAARFRAKLAGQPSPSGELTARVLAGNRRSADDRGYRQHSCCDTS